MTMKKDWRLIIVILVLGVMWGGCVRYTTCSRTTGCATFLYLQKSNDSIVAQKIICADSNTIEDITYNEEIRMFREENERDGLYIRNIDTGMTTVKVSVRNGTTFPKGYECFLRK